MSWGIQANREPLDEVMEIICTSQEEIRGYLEQMRAGALQIQRIRERFEQVVKLSGEDHAR